MVQEEFEEKKKMIEEFVGSKGYRSMSVKEMAMVLQVPSRDKKDFREVLDALGREGKISIDLKGKIKPLPADVKVGKYMATQRGFGFVRVEGRYFHSGFLYQERTGWRYRAGTCQKGRRRRQTARGSGA